MEETGTRVARIPWWCRACMKRSVCRHSLDSGAYQAIFDIQDSHRRASPECERSDQLGFLGDKATAEEVDNYFREFEFAFDPDSVNDLAEGEG